MFDKIVITAANESQAAGYRARINWRKKTGLLPEATEVDVISDPGGKRIGSLGATINALSRIGDVAYKRVLICHSGGDGRRTPAYAAAGKVFTPMPLTTKTGTPLALFDLIVANADALPAPAAGHVLILSGDVLLTFDAAAVDFSKPGVTGVAYYDSLEQGSRHGVYVPQGAKAACTRVRDFLQKPDGNLARKAGAVNCEGLVPVDTGVLSLDAETSRRLVHWAERESLGDFTKVPAMDIYETFTYALIGRAGKSGEAATLQSSLKRALKGTQFHVNMLPFCDFFHMGSSRELLAGLTESSKTSSNYAFRTGDAAFTAFNSTLPPAGICAKGALVEGCALEKSKSITLAGRNILTGVPAACTCKIALPPETGLVCLPVGDTDWVAASYPFEDAYVKNVYWYEKRWCVGKINDVVKEACAQAQAGFVAVEKLPAAKSRRLAFGEIIPRVNHARALALREDIFAKQDAIKRDNIAKVAAAVANGFTPPKKPTPAAILQDQVVWVTTPVRIDLAGGWSDTPPICMAEGGAVFGAALTLNGQYPVQAMAKLNEKGLIRISSIDLGESRTFASAAEIQDHSDPHDWCSLVKAALIITGIVPEKKGESLAAWLKALGGGLDITTFSALPKGSGMGTSSVLGAAVIACLERVLGKAHDATRIIRLTSILEQRLSTGGGWEDQVCGTLPGVKLMTTLKGPNQTPTITTLSAADTEWFKKQLATRALLYFTGEKRLARDILRNVVNGYLAGETRVTGTIAPLKECAHKMAAALKAHDFARFATCLKNYWVLKKRIDPGSTTRAIEKLLARVQNRLEAFMLPGAGGGGFIFMIAKSKRDAAAIRANFTAEPPNALARFFDFAIDPAGLRITVL